MTKIHSYSSHGRVTKIHMAICVAYNNIALNFKLDWRHNILLSIRKRQKKIPALQFFIPSGQIITPSEIFGYFFEVKMVCLWSGKWNFDGIRLCQGGCLSGLSVRFGAIMLSLIHYIDSTDLLITTQKACAGMWRGNNCYLWTKRWCFILLIPSGRLSRRKCADAMDNGHLDLT